MSAKIVMLLLNFILNVSQNCHVIIKLYIKCQPQLSCYYSQSLKLTLSDFFESLKSYHLNVLNVLLILNTIFY